MQAGIIGLPNVGKSTLFNALTAAGAEASNYPFCTIEPNVGAVPIPDKRLKTINAQIETKAVLPTSLLVVDIAGLVKGASDGEELGNKFLSHIRQVDTIIQVVRCFENQDIVHVHGELDPVRDIEVIETELMLADLQLVETALPKAEKSAKKGDEEAVRRAELLRRCREALDAGNPVGTLNVSEPADQSALRGLGMLSAKRNLYVTNVDENDLHGAGEIVSQVRSYTEKHGGEVIPVCAQIEAELAELDEPDRREMLDSLGMKEPALDRLVHAAYRLLGLQSYFTAGPKEIRAWTIPVGATAPQAAGAIHSDFERGFIRVEVYQVSDLEELHSEAAIKAAGRMRLEGKDYVMQDGDVCHFLFNV